MTIHPTANAILITGRLVGNYSACGETIPATRVIHNCLGCQQPVTVSLEADEILRTGGKQPGIAIVGAICSDCALRATKIAASGNVTTTAPGAELMATNPRRKAFFDELKKNMERSAEGPPEGKK